MWHRFLKDPISFFVKNTSVIYEDKLSRFNLIHVFEFLRYRMILKEI